MSPPHVPAACPRRDVLDRVGSVVWATVAAQFGADGVESPADVGIPRDAEERGPQIVRWGRVRRQVHADPDGRQLFGVAELVDGLWNGNGRHPAPQRLRAGPHPGVRDEGVGALQDSDLGYEVWLSRLTVTDRGTGEL
ncbi:MAG: hypothetical protein QOF25_5611 [Mycobacterium sp.]|nr:hypothetical protein [Mycobacterium sp.]